MRTKLSKKLNYRYRQFLAYHSIRHIAGPRHFDLLPDQVVCIVIGKNISFYIDGLFSHHENLGVRRFIYLDNGSTDDSIDRATLHSNTIVLRCDLPFREYQGHFRRAASTKHVRGGWRLMVDADELFDYPGSEWLGIEELARVLNARNHTAVVAQMLDFVPADPNDPALKQSYTDAIAACRYYNIDHIRKLDYFSTSTEMEYYFSKNTITNPEIKVFFDGIRNYLFGESCCLTKHPLIFSGRTIDPFPHPHVSTRIHCADFSALLKHYKFTGDFVARERQDAVERRYTHDEGKRRLAVYEASSSFSFAAPGNREQASIARLLNDEFLVASPDAREALGL